MTSSPEKSYIEELKKSLYSRTAPDIRTKRKLHFDEQRDELKRDWDHPKNDELPTALTTKYEDHHMSFFTKLLIASALFCIVAVGVGAFMFFNGANLISGDNIEISIHGPVSIPGGEPVSFDIVAKNNNNADLQLVDMLVEFPSGTANPADPSQSLTNYRKLMGDIPAGGSAKQTVEAIVYGEQNLQKQVKVILTYNVKGSTTSFTKTKTYDLLIKSSPISININSFKEITSGQEFNIKVDVKSNSENVLKNIVLKARYPFGFTVIESSLPAFFENSAWKIGDIQPGKSVSLNIKGKLTGENSDLRNFRFTVGTQSMKDPGAIGTEYAAAEQEITIEKPFVSLKIAVNGDNTSADHVGKFGQSERVDIEWFNNLPVAVSNMVITAKLSGSAYDKTLVDVDEGNFDSAKNILTWNSRSKPELRSVKAGDSGRVTFSFVPTDFSSGSNQISNPTVTYEVSVSGDRPQEENVSSRINGAAIRSTRITTNASLSGRIVRSVGPFTNTGVVPPQAEKETTYTVIWSIDNTVNPMENAEVTATLPSHVKWMNSFSPSSENISFDSNTGTVTWYVGNVSANTLKSARRREVAFQIAVTPNITDVDKYLTLIDTATLSGKDSFTRSSVTDKQEYLTTRFSTDPAYREGDETVKR